MYDKGTLWVKNHEIFYNYDLSPISCSFIGMTSIIVKNWSIIAEKLSIIVEKSIIVEDLKKIL